MSLHSVLLSLVTEDNDYQRAQADAARSAAIATGMQVEIQYAENDAVLQVQQVIKAVQQKPKRHDAIIVQPVGTSMEQAARLATASGFAWGILNYETTYVSPLRRTSDAVVFEVTNNQVEIGRIQAKQVTALLPQGGVALYIEGPSTGTAAGRRAEGMRSALPANVELRILKGDWTREKTRKSVESWLALSTSRKLGIGAVICQNDAMAMGVREAIENTLFGAERERWLSFPITGCDGLPNGGQELVKRGILAATIIIPPNAGTAVKLFAGSLKGQSIPEKTICVASSYPPEEQLRSRAAVSSSTAH